MSESARRRLKATPQNSDAPDGASETGTPYSNLRQLAGVIRNPSTPFGRASSAGPTSGGRSRTPNIAIRTPGTAARTPRGGPATRPIPARRAAPTTPHAIRALRERANAARTPGHVRRRSGRVQRETPRDILRDLSRALASRSRPVQASPQILEPTPRNPALDEVEDGPDPVAPRLSMPLGDLDDDSFHEAPPRQSLLPDLPDDLDATTLHSLEFGRRALSEDPRQLFSTRLSERFADLQELGGDAVSEFEIDGTFINRRNTGELLVEEEADEPLEETTLDLRALGGRQSDLGVFGEDDETEEPTFRFTVPQRIQGPLREEQPEEDADAQLDVEYDDVVADDDDDAVPGFQQDMDDTQSEGSVEADLQAYRGEPSAIDRTLLTEAELREELAKESTSKPARRQRKELRVSRFGHEYPQFPPAVVKKLASGFMKSQGSSAKISKDTLAAIMQGTDWFFEQISEDLASYADHAGRKNIEDADVITLMKRQRQIGPNATPFSLAQKLLPRELLQDLRMAPPAKIKGKKRKRMETIIEE